MKISVTAIAQALRQKRWSLDYRNQAWKLRWVDIADGAAKITEERNPGTGGRNFIGVYYTGNPARYWMSQDFDDLREAVNYVNQHLDNAIKAYNGDLERTASTKPYATEKFPDWKKNRTASWSFLAGTTTIGALTWTTGVARSYVDSHGAYRPSLHYMETTTPEGWKAYIRQSFGETDLGDKAGRNCFVLDIKEPDGDVTTKTFYEREGEKAASAFAEDEYKKFLSGQTKDPSKYLVSVHFIDNYLNEPVVILDLYYRSVPGQRNLRPSVQAYMKPLDEAVERISDEIQKRKLNPKEIALDTKAAQKSTWGKVPRLRTFQDLIAFSRKETLPSVEEAAPLPTGSDGKEKVLEDLLRKSPDPFIKDSLEMLQRGDKLDEERLKGIRYRLYKNRMKDDAEMFRMAAQVAARYVRALASIRGTAGDAQAIKVLDFLRRTT